MVLARLEALGKKLGRRRRAWEDRHGDDDTSMPKLINAALDNLREVAAKRLGTGDENAETTIVEILARAAREIRGA
jgi:hypothetical protein